MKKLIQIPLALFIVSNTLWISCKNKSIDNPEFRNENYIWFVPDGNSMGRWILINNSSKSILANGTCTEFFSNGDMRKKYQLNHEGFRDTTTYYNDSGKAFLQTFLNVEDYEYYILRDGQFNFFTYDRKLAISGIAINHRLENPSFHGEFKGIQNLASLVNCAKKNADSLFRKTASIAIEFKKSRNKNLSKDKINELRSLQLKTVSVLDSLEVVLTNNKLNQNSQKLKEESIILLEESSAILKDDFDRLIPLFEKELDLENRKKISRLVIPMVTESAQIRKRWRMNFFEYYDKFIKDDFLLIYLI